MPGRNAPGMIRDDSKMEIAELPDFVWEFHGENPWVIPYRAHPLRTKGGLKGDLKGGLKGGGLRGGFEGGA